MRYILDKLHSELAVVSELTSALSLSPPSSVASTSANGNSTSGSSSSSGGRDGEDSNNSSTIVSEIFGGVLQSDVRIM